MDEQEGRYKLLHPDPPDRDIEPREAMVMCLEFLRSDFFRYVWYPRYLEEMELTDINAMRQSEPNVRLQWLDRRAALRAIEDSWLTGWLSPPLRDRKEEAQKLSEVVPEVVRRRPR